MRDILYSPPEGEGPSVVAKLTCFNCRYRNDPVSGIICHHPSIGRRTICVIYETPSWCPIVQADPEAWQRRLKGG